MECCGWPGKRVTIQRWNQCPTPRHGRAWPGHRVEPGRDGSGMRCVQQRRVHPIALAADRLARLAHATRPTGTPRGQQAGAALRPGCFPRAFCACFARRRAPRRRLARPPRRAAPQEPPLTAPRRRLAPARIRPAGPLSRRAAAPPRTRWWSRPSRPRAPRSTPARRASGCASTAASTSARSRLVLHGPENAQAPLAARGHGRPGPARRPRGGRPLGAGRVAAALAGAGARRPHHPRRRALHPPPALGASTALDQLLDLYGFVSVVLRAAELAARTVLLGGVAFWALLLPFAPRLSRRATRTGCRRIGRRTVLAGAAATLVAKLAGGGLGLLALAATLESPATGVFGADFVLALAVVPARGGGARPPRPAARSAGAGPPRRAARRRAGGGRRLRRRQPRHRPHRGPADAARRDRAAPDRRRALGGRAAGAARGAAPPAGNGGVRRAALLRLRRGRASR